MPDPTTTEGQQDRVREAIGGPTLGPGYWGRTDRITSEGLTPTCPACGEKMFPCDDHGRFTCFCQGLRATQF